MPALFQGAPARLLGGLLLVTGLSATSVAQEPRRPPRQPVVLNADDVPAFPERPAGIDKKRDDIPHGKLEMLSYESKAVGTTGRSKGISSISLNRPRRA